MLKSVYILYLILLAVSINIMYNKGIIFFAGENAVFYWILYIVFGFLSLIAQKNGSVVIGGSKNRKTTAVYMIIQSAVACAFFFVSGGFRLQVNTVSLLFAAAFSALCILSLLLNINIYKYYAVAKVNVIGNIGSLVLTAVLGVALFSEPFSLKVFLKCLLMTAAVLLTFFSRNTNENNAKGKIWLLLLFPINSALVWILQKAYVRYPGTVSNPSFCFFTNAYIIVIFCAILFIPSKKAEETLCEEAKIFSKKALYATIFTVITANVIQLLQLRLLATTDVVLFNPISSALNLVYCGAVSLIYREKLHLLNVIAIVISIIVLFI